MYLCICMSLIQRVCCLLVRLSHVYMHVIDICSHAFAIFFKFVHFTCTGVCTSFICVCVCVYIYIIYLYLICMYMYIHTHRHNHIWAMHRVNMFSKGYVVHTHTHTHTLSLSHRRCIGSTSFQRRSPRSRVRSPRATSPAWALCCQ
jgi:hypothetical protein